MRCALFKASATKAVEVGDSFICGKYHTFLINSVFSGDKMLSHPTHVGLADFGMHKSIIHNRYLDILHFLDFQEVSGSVFPWKNFKELQSLTFFNMVLFLIPSLHMLYGISSQSQIIGYSVIIIITTVSETLVVQPNFFFRGWLNF